MSHAAFKPRLIVLLAVAAASLTAVVVASLVSSPGVASAQGLCGMPQYPACPGNADPRVHPNGDPDGDGVPNSRDICPEANGVPAAAGKPGCRAFWWEGSVGQSNLADTVDDGYVALHSRCQPGICTTTFTLTAGKKARKALGLKKALIGRKTLRQKLNRGGGPDSAVAEFDLPRKVVRKMDDLDKIELEAKFVVSAPNSTTMQAVKFTKSGTVKLDRRRPRSNSAPRGQGLRLYQGTSPQGLKQVNAD